MSPLVMGTSDKIKSINIWHKELKALGYKDPLPAPMPSVQAVLCAMTEPIHRFVQEQDLYSLKEVNVDGGTRPLLLNTLDLSDWTHLLFLLGTNPEASFIRLRAAHCKMIDILEKDDRDLEASDTIMPALERVLARANANDSSPMPKMEGSKSDHPLVARIALSADEQAAIAHYKESLLSKSASDIRNYLLRNPGKRCNIPLSPPRSVEKLLMSRGHRAWTLNCSSHLAPISIHMWQTWSRLTNEDVETCRKNALNNTGHIKEAVTIPHAFPLSAFDPNKCSSPDVKLLTKLELPTGEARKEKYLKDFWNCGRPYLRCDCKARGANDGRCDGSVIWWDHAIWLMLNRLELFFGEEHPTLRSKLAAFWIWIAAAGKVAVKSHLTFSFRRDLTMEAVLEYANDQNRRLLASYGDCEGVRQIERLIKPPSFTLAHPPSIRAGGKHKKQKLNVNAAPFFPQRGAGGFGGLNKIPVPAKKPVSPFEEYEMKPSVEQLKPSVEQLKRKAEEVDRKPSMDDVASCSTDEVEPAASVIDSPVVAEACPEEDPQTK